VINCYLKIKSNIQFDYKIMKFVIIRVVNRLLHSNHEKPMLKVLNQTYYISSKRMLYKLAVSVNSY